MRLLLKFCGNKSLEDLQTTANSNADFLGFIFAKSRREVQPEKVKEWLKTVQLKEKKIVGVFVNASVAQIESVVREVPLSIIQCHGGETPEQLKDIKEATGLPVWKVIHHDKEAYKQLNDFSGIADGYVIDSKVSGQWGGTGVSFDWSFLPHYLAMAEKQGVPCLIAGGVHPENVDELLRYQPHGIDISSGIEYEGMKNEQKIQLIEKKVRLYESSS
jgi:phosphoribosylanthranilate isomerase